MPPNSSLQPTPKKGTVGGIPTWGWIVGALIGIVIGYFLVRTSPGSPISSPGGTGGGTAETPSESQPQTGGVPFEDVLKALGLSPGAGTVPPDRVSTSTSQTDAANATTESVPSSPEIAAATASPVTASSPVPDLIAAGYSPEAASSTASAVSSGYLTPDSSPLGLSTSQFTGYTGTETPVGMTTQAPPAPVAVANLSSHLAHGRDVPQ